MEDSQNFEGRGLLHSDMSSKDPMRHTGFGKMPKEENKIAISEESNEEESNDIKFMNEQDGMLKKKNTLHTQGSESERDQLISELKKSKNTMNKVLQRKEKIVSSQINDYNEKFKRDADEEFMDVGVVDLADLETEFGMIEDERERKRKQRELEFEHRKKGIELTSQVTQNKLINTQTQLLKDIAQEEIEARKKAVEREKIIQKEFRRVEDKISGIIRQHRAKILSYFGPLMQEKKKSVYTILDNTKKKVDFSARTKICLPFSIKIKMLRCVKDKMEAGVYVVLAEIIDRIGGHSINYNYQKSMKNIAKLKDRIIEYEKLKMRFLKEQKIEISTNEYEELLDENQQIIENPAEEDKDSASRPDSAMIANSRSSKSNGFEIDKEKYEKLTFLQRHTKYRNFFGGFMDEEFYVDENLYLLYPPMNRSRPSNCIQFKVIKLSNETSLDDKVVGWGVFPILDSELAFNEGRFKIPIMHGDVDEKVTLYRTIQSKYMKNLDSWLCNMYFEVEPLLIQKLVFDWRNKDMYYAKSQLNKTYGAVIVKNNDLNMSSLQQNLRNSIIRDNDSRRENMSRRSSVIKDQNRSSLNLLNNLSQVDLNKTPSRAQLNRQQTQLLENVINEETGQYKKELEQEIRKEFEDDTLMLETYKFSVSDKFNHETRNVAKKKLVYLFTESLADIGLK